MNVPASAHGVTVSFLTTLATGSNHSCTAAVAVHTGSGWRLPNSTNASEK